MRRAILVCTVLGMICPTWAQSAERVWRIGALALLDDGSVHSAILPYLAARGFVEGRNLVMDFRVGTEEQVPELALAIVADKPDVVIAISDWALNPIRAATSTIPIVAAPIGVDPVRAGIAKSWARPGGNITGVSLIAPELEPKRLSLLHEALPSVRRVALLANHRKVVEGGLSPMRRAAESVGIELIELWAESANDYAAAFDTMRGSGAEAILLVPTPEINRDTELLVALASKARLPTIGGHRESAQSGALIGYGPSLKELRQQVASYVERILNGAQAGELPFQGPTRIDFVINMRTAKELGISIPSSTLVGAAEVIE